MKTKRLVVYSYRLNDYNDEKVIPTGLFTFNREVDDEEFVDEKYSIGMDGKLDKVFSYFEEARTFNDIIELCDINILTGGIIHSYKIDFVDLLSDDFLRYSDRYTVESLELENKNILLMGVDLD